MKRRTFIKAAIIGLSGLATPLMPISKKDTGTLTIYGTKNKVLQEYALPEDFMNTGKHAFIFEAKEDTKITWVRLCHPEISENAEHYIKVNFRLMQNDSLHCGYNLYLPAKGPYKWA